MRHRCARLAGIAVCAAALAAGSASAETLTYTTPGTTTVVLPTGVARVHVVAVGGRGGGALGGFGAVVSGDLSVFSLQGAPTILVAVGGNGGIGSAGAQGGGATPALPSLAGGGGGWSGVTVCRSFVNGRCRSRPTLLAGGGGGAGADFLPGLGGAGGAAGAPGMPGAAVVSLGAATGGASANGGGAGSTSSDPDCAPGDPGGHGTAVVGGTGGASPTLDGRGDGGGGGGGNAGGGGGGGACADGTGSSGAGGAGGTSTVPRGGQLAIDTTGEPSVTISYEIDQPTVTITSPADGATYAQGRRVRAAYACRQSPLLLRARIASCAGTVAVGRRIDTRSLGDHAFTVTARDELGITAVTTVHYRVTDQTRPQIRRLGIVRRSLSLSDRRPTANVHFLLSEPARVVVRVGRAAPSAARSARARARIISARQGWNRFELRPRIGRRTLPPGEYRLTLVAIDQAGNRSRPAQRIFHVIE